MDTWAGVSSILFVVFLIMIFGGYDMIVAIVRMHHEHRERIAKIKAGIDPDKE